MVVNSPLGSFLQEKVSKDGGLVLLYLFIVISSRRKYLNVEPHSAVLAHCYFFKKNITEGGGLMVMRMLLVISEKKKMWGRRLKNVCKVGRVPRDTTLLEPN